jgi:small subunit ribosomal protein S4e
MARRGQKKHLKRLPAPRHWPIKRKAGKFTTRVIPGPHPKEYSLTLAIILRELLEHANDMREVKVILSAGQIMVDGRTRKDPRYPVGMMDVLEITSSGELFRLIPKRRGGLRLVPIEDSEKGIKLCRIEKKIIASGGRVQLTLHDGRNILLPKEADPSEYHNLDTLKIAVPDQEILELIPLKTGVQAIVSRGRNVGIEGKVIEIERRFGTHASTVTLESSDGTRFQTALEYVFALGIDEPEITVGGSGE